MDTTTLPLDPSLDSLKPLLSILGPRFAWVIPVLIYWHALSLIGRMFSGRIEAFASSRLAWQVDTAGSDRDQWIQGILQSKVYRLFAFSLNFTFRVNLPSIASYRKQMSAQGTDTAFIAKKDIDKTTAP